MSKTVTAAMLIGALALGGVAHAQTAVSLGAAPAQQQADDAPVGKKAGTLMVRVRAIGLIPENTSSSISAIGGHVNATAQAAPEIDLSYFFTDHIAIEGIAASTRHSISAGHSALGHVDVGSAYVLPPTVTLQYHFMPHSRFSPYVGVGLTVAFFYDTNPSGPTVTKFGLDTTVGPAIQAGFDYNFSGHWFANFDVKQIFINTTARINGGTIVAKTALNPTVVGAGIGYRF